MRRPSEARPYISKLFEHAGAESDPNKFYQRISSVASLCELRLKSPGLPDYVELSDRRKYSADQSARLINQHRKELQAQVDAWPNGK